MFGELGKEGGPVVGEGKTVLVVDDEPAMQSMAAKLVESRGYRALTASSGNEALELLKRMPIDLIVLDVVMPDLDGLQTIEQARQLGFENIPVILLTAQKEKQAVLGGYQKGAVFYITKPLRPAHLLNAVDYLIGNLSEQERQKLESVL
jgi:CheY-like chemotaxis protein